MMRESGSFLVELSFIQFHSFTTHLRFASLHYRNKSLLKVLSIAFITVGVVIHLNKETHLCFFNKWLYYHQHYLFFILRFDVWLCFSRLVFMINDSLSDFSCVKISFCIAGVIARHPSKPGFWFCTFLPLCHFRRPNWIFVAFQKYVSISVSLF